MSGTLNGEQQYCTFRVENLYLGISVLDVQEVLYEATVTHVPLADDFVAGLINLRGQIATTVDLRRKLDIPPRTDDETFIHVVVSERGEPASIQVDRISDVITVDAELFEQVPDTMEGPARELILGAFKLDGELLLILDVHKALANEHERNEEEEMAA